VIAGKQQVKRHVLIAEDEKVLAEMLSDLFEDAGYEVITFQTADEACANLHQHVDKLDLLFTDVKMPGSKTGIDLVFAARTNRPDLPIIVSSGYFDGPIQQISHVTLLPKPWSLEKLLDVCGLDPI
jgi:CheY-like chemotaxis protein